MITKREYIDTFTDEIAKKLIRFTPQIFLKTEKSVKRSDPGYEAIGSSLLIQIQGRKFLITAGHVVNNRIRQIGFLEGELFHAFDGRIIYINPDEDQVSKFTDLAVCELDNISVDFSSQHFDFLDGDTINFDYRPSNNESFLIVGFPWRKTKFDPTNKRMRVIPFRFLTDYYTGEHVGELKSFKDQNLFLGYTQRKIVDSKTGHYKKAVNPEGLSGCGVWHLPKIYLHDINKAIVNIAGIIIRQDEHTKQFIIATRIHIVAEILRLYFDINLKPSMISRLNKH
jgi:hypothetical protein